MAILVIFRPILTCLICLKGVFRQKTHFSTLGHPFLALKCSRELISTFLLCLGPLCTVPPPKNRSAVVQDIRGRWKLITCWVLMLEMDVLGWENEFFA